MLLNKLQEKLSDYKASTGQAPKSITLSPDLKGKLFQEINNQLESNKLDENASLIFLGCDVFFEYNDNETIIISN